jgi:hypothetical protein
MSADLRRDFFDGEEDEKAVVAAFVSNKTNAESALKTKPRVRILLFPHDKSLSVFRFCSYEQSNVGLMLREYYFRVMRQIIGISNCSD